MQASMASSWPYNDIDNGLAANFEDSLSGLGVELSSSAYKMSEAILALPLFDPRNKDEEVLATSVVSENVNEPVTTSTPIPSSSLNAGGLITTTAGVTSSPSVATGTGRAQGSDHLVSAATLGGAVATNSPTPSQNMDHDDKRYVGREMRGFAYILHAATSPATKVNEETLTYLNQGQPYELTIRYNSLVPVSSNTLYRSILRVGFHERRMQFMEQEHLEYWQQTRPGERLLDIDIPLSYGLREVQVDRNSLNSAEFIWGPQIDCGVYIKVHCISTEFTAKKHGGEKGVPFRLQVDTFALDTGEFLHSAASQIKVFKPKGADRKHKTDRDKVERRTNSDRDTYKPSCDVTWLMDIPIQAPSGSACGCSGASEVVSGPQSSSGPSSSPGGPPVPNASPLSSGECALGVVSPGLLHTARGQLRSPPRNEVTKDTSTSGFPASNGLNSDAWASSPSSGTTSSSSSSVLAAALGATGSGRKTSAVASGLIDGWKLAGGKSSRSGQAKKAESPGLPMPNIKAALLNGSPGPQTGSSGGAGPSGPPPSSGGKASGGRVARNSAACSPNAQASTRVGPLSSIMTNGMNMKQEYGPPMATHSQSLSPADIQDDSLMSSNNELTLYSSNQDVVDWMQQNRFAQYIRVFQNFSGSDLLRLSRADLIEICGTSDGIRLSNALQQKPPRPRLTIFVAHENETIFNAIFMYRFSVEELAARLAALLNVPPERVQQLYIGGPSDIAVVVTDEVVNNIEERSRFSLHLVRTSGATSPVDPGVRGLEILLKPLPS